MNNPEDFRILDLYCGAGGLGTGFEKLFEVPKAVDFNKDACKTYQQNHIHTQVHQKSVWEFLHSDIIPRDYEIVVAHTDSTQYGMIGGPPCQEFSVLNQSPNLTSERANQLFIMLDGIQLIQPEFAVIENVASIPKNFKIHAVSFLEKLGYKCTAKVIKAVDYGSVQIRRRWILIASKYRSIFPQPRFINSPRKAKEILTSFPSEIPMSEKIKEGIQNLPRGKWVALPWGKWKEMFIVDPEKPLPAIINIYKNRMVKPDKSGYLTFQEIAMAQGFPKNYSFAGSKTSIAQQIANAIPVELSTAISEAIYEKYFPHLWKKTKIGLDLFLESPISTE